MAAAVSMLFVIKHFGYNLMARVQLWATGCSGAMRERLFIFWGINEPSYLLAADIRRTLKAGTYRLVFVKTADDGDETSAPTGLDRLFCRSRTGSSTISRNSTALPPPPLPV